MGHILLDEMTKQYNNYRNIRILSHISNNITNKNINFKIIF